MKTGKIFSILALFSLILLLSGCGSAGTESPTDEVVTTSNIYKSIDGGISWIPQEDEATSLASRNILSLVLDSQDGERVFLGLESGGIIKTENGGATWSQLENFKASKVYGLALVPGDENVIYASGVWQKRGKIYKSYDAGETWKEIYTEAAEGPLVTSLAMDENSPETLFAANSEDIILKTNNGGETWKNIWKSDKPVTRILISPLNSNIIFLITSGQDVYRSLDGGINFVDVSDKVDESLDESGSFYSGAFDAQGRIFLGGDAGIIRSSNNGESWEKLETLSDSETFPVRALDVDPYNSNEIIYGAARAIYRSTDNGLTWSAFQLDTAGIAGNLSFSRSNSNVVYFSLKKQ